MEEARFTFLSSDELRKFLINSQSVPGLLRTTGKTPEKLLQEMPEVQYEVIKVMFGRRVQRILRLDGTGINNVTSKGVTSYYSYENIVNVILTSLTSFTLVYTCGKHPYVYQSPVGMQIVQEIQTRRSLKKLVNQISDTLAYTDITLPTAEEEEQLTIPQVIIPNVSPRPQNRPLSRVLGIPRSNSLQFSTSPIPVVSASEKRANKLSRLFGDSEEQRQEAQITKYLLNNSTPEGKSIYHFVHNFSVLEKNVHTLASNVRTFMNSLKDYILKEHRVELIKLSIHCDDDEDTNSPLIPNISEVTEKTIQKVLFPKINPRLKIIVQNFHLQSDLTVQHAVNMLAEKSQDYFQIEKKIQSPSEWEEAVLMLNHLPMEELPWGQIKMIMETFRVISNLFAVEHQGEVSGPEPLTISGDDLLPIFIFVLVRSSIPKLVSVSEYLWNLIDSGASTGQAGYYLSVFTSAVQYLKNFGEENPKIEIRETDFVLII